MKKRQIGAFVGVGVLIGAVGMMALPATSAPTAAECEQLLTRAGSAVSGYENSRYAKCRFDRLEELLGAQQTSSPSPSVTPSSSPSSTASQPPSVTPSSTPTASTTAAPNVLSLPVKPYAGGPLAWGEFPAAKAAGWTDPGFFPIALWYGQCGDKETAFMKAKAVNTLAQCNPNTTVSQVSGLDTLFSPRDSGGNYVGQAGALLDDEVDGRFTDEAGIKLLTDLAARARSNGKGRFTYANYTGSLITFDRTLNPTQGRSSKGPYVNGEFNDVISIDQYFYSVPQCDWSNADQAFRWPAPAGQTPINRANCRSASSYGKVIDLQREVDAADGKLDKPIWAFVEIISPDAVGGQQNGGQFKQISPDGVKAAAWQSIIHGAAGIHWFSNSFEDFGANKCATGDAFGTAANGGDPDCPAIVANVNAAGQVGAQITSFAPILNGASFEWDAGADTDTLTKQSDGYLYMFAMTADGGSGSRTLTLPAGLTGNAEVVGENRAVAVSGTKLTDTFSAETDLNVYKIKIG